MTHIDPTAASTVIGLAILCAIATLLLVAARQTRRTELRALERRARPPGVDPGTAAEDAAAILRNNLNKEQRQ